MGFEKLVYKNLIILALKNVSRSYTAVILLIEEARKDFPQLKDSEIQINRYSEGNLKDVYGIEFDRPIGASVPDDYREIDMAPLYY